MNTDLITEFRPTKSAPLLGFWYPVTTSTSLAVGQMQSQVMLGQPILVCRDRQGQVAAMRDICPHRGMPLSFGHFDGERVECAYHGWQFDMGGRCRHIPALIEGSQLKPEKIGIASYPCQDRDGYIWVFLADPRQPNEPVPGTPAPPVAVRTLSHGPNLHDLGLHHRRRHCGA